MFSLSRRSVRSFAVSASSAAACSFAASNYCCTLRHFHSGGGGGGGGSGGNSQSEELQKYRNEFGRYFNTFPELSTAKQETLSMNIMRDPLLSTADYVAEEKVHGSNFQLILIKGGTQLIYGKRTALLPPSENFFGYQVLHNTLLAQAKFIYGEVQKYLAEQRQPGSTAAAAAAAADSSTAAAAPLPEIACLRVYGELLGGKCDHPDAPACTATYALGGVPNRRVTKVQNDAFPQYSKSLHFFAFQINYTVDEADLPDGWERYERSEATLPYDVTQDIFARTPNNWLYARPLLRGPIQKVACLPSDFMTTIPMHLPTLNKGLGNAYIRNNRAEGLIIRSTLLGTPQAAQMEVSSLLLKAKSPFFQELRHKMEDPTKKRADPMANAREAAIAKYGTQMTDISAAFPPEWLPMARHLVDHVAPQRLSAVVSKIGPEAIVNGSVGGQRGLAYLLAKDALKDFLKGCEKATLFCPLLVRRELARYALFESKKLVAESWADLVAQAGVDDAASDSAESVAAAEGSNSSGTASAAGGTTAFAAAAAAPAPASTAQ